MKKTLTQKARISAAGTESQRPRSPRNCGRISIEAAMKTNVRQKEIAAARLPSPNAVKK